jgi:hypothetical protein
MNQQGRPPGRQVALNIRYLPREPLPHSLVDVVEIELRGRVANETLQRAAKIVAPASRGTFARADPISANPGSALVRARMWESGLR